MTPDEAIEKLNDCMSETDKILWPECLTAHNLGIEALERQKNSQGIAQFAYKVAEVMNNLRSSHVFFILQQAFGEETEWSDAQEILNNIITWGKVATDRLPSETYIPESVGKLPSDE